MGKDFGIFALIFGSINLLVSLEVATFLSFLGGGDSIWSLPFPFAFFLFILGYVLFFLAVIFGVVGIRKSSSMGIIGMAIAGVVLGFFGLCILTYSPIELVMI